MEKIVHKGIYAQVRQSRRAAHGGHIAGKDTEIESSYNFFGAQFKSIKVCHHQFFVAFGGGFHQHFTELFCSCFKCCGNRDLFFIFAVELLCGHGSKINISYIISFFHNGKLDRYAGNAEFLAQCIHCFVKVCIFAVHLVDDNHVRHFRLFAELHHFFGAYNRTGNSAADYQSGIRKCHCFINFAVKIKKAGSVDEVYFCAFPFKRSNSAAYRNMPLLFFRIIV